MSRPPIPANWWAIPAGELPDGYRRIHIGDPILNVWELYWLNEQVDSHTIPKVQGRTPVPGSIAGPANPLYPDNPGADPFAGIRMKQGDELAAALSGVAGPAKAAAAS